MNQVFERMPQQFTGIVMQYGVNGVTKEDAMQLLDCPRIQSFGDVSYLEKQVWLDEKDRCVKVMYEQIACKMY